MFEYKKYFDGNINGSGYFYGYASIFNIKDSYSDIILPNAFSDTILTKNLQDIKLLWQHNQKREIGKITKLYEDELGLYIEGQINETEDEIYAMVKSGFIDGLSIGYRANDYSFENDTRILKSIDLVEVSIVSQPANRYSNITYCKSLASIDSNPRHLNHSIDRVINIVNDPSTIL